MTSKQGLLRGMIAVVLAGSAALPITGLLIATPAGRVAPQVWARPGFDFTTRAAGWVDEFERFAARQTIVTAENNVVVVAKAVPGPDTLAPADTIEPKDAPKQLNAADTDDSLLVTGSIKSQHLPLLPPVPGPDAFKVQKGDRLGGTQRVEPSHGAPLGTETPPDAGTPVPHAELVAPKPIQLPSVKSAMLLPVRSNKLAVLQTASLSSKPMDLAPAKPDPLFQGPPMPADPTLDPDAPVLGYTEQMASAEAPFKALFAVTPTEKRSWLAVNTAVAKVKPGKPVKTAHLPPRRHSRKHEG